MGLEARITINGVELTVPEAMTVRVALSSFAADLRDGLGDDEIGFQICNGYNRCLSNIFKAIRKDPDEKEPGT